MVLPVSGPITSDDIQEEFNQTVGSSFDIEDFYRNGGIVPSTSGVAGGVAEVQIVGATGTTSNTFAAGQNEVVDLTLDSRFFSGATAGELFGEFQGDVTTEGGTIGTTSNTGTDEASVTFTIPETYNGDIHFALQINGVNNITNSGSLIVTRRLDRGADGAGVFSGSNFTVVPLPEDSTNVSVPLRMVEAIGVTGTWTITFQIRSSSSAAAARFSYDSLQVIADRRTTPGTSVGPSNYSFQIDTEGTTFPAAALTNTIGAQLNSSDTLLEIGNAVTTAYPTTTLQQRRVIRFDTTNWNTDHLNVGIVSLAASVSAPAGAQDNYTLTTSDIDTSSTEVIARSLATALSITHNNSGEVSQGVYVGGNVVEHQFSFDLPEDFSIALAVIDFIVNPSLATSLTGSATIASVFGVPQVNLDIEVDFSGLTFPMTTISSRTSFDSLFYFTTANQDSIVALPLPLDTTYNSAAELVQALAAAEFTNNSTGAPSSSVRGTYSAVQGSETHTLRVTSTDTYMAEETVTIAIDNDFSYPLTVTDMNVGGQTYTINSGSDTVTSGFPEARRITINTNQTADIRQELTLTMNGGFYISNYLTAIHGEPGTGTASSYTLTDYSGTEVVSLTATSGEVVSSIFARFETAVDDNTETPIDFMAEAAGNGITLTAQTVGSLNPGAVSTARWVATVDHAGGDGDIAFANFVQTVRGRDTLSNINDNVPESGGFTFDNFHGATFGDN